MGIVVSIPVFDFSMNNHNLEEVCKMNKELFFSGMRTMVLGIGVSALVVGCSGGEEEVGPAPEVGDGTVSGMISFEGEAPERTVIEAEGDEICAAMHADAPLLSERAIVSAVGELANVFVYVTNPPEGEYAAPEESVKLNQVGCTYIPHVLGVQVGQPLELVNSDDTLHNVRGVARKNKAMNYAQPAGSKPRTKTFKKEEMSIRMKCDLHPWMTAYVFAMGHPYFGISDESGAFRIEGLPTGDYEVTAWHEQFGEKTGTVTVDESGTGKVDFTFSS